MVIRAMTPRSDGYIPPCIPTRAAKPPAGSDGVHEIKPLIRYLHSPRIVGVSLDQTGLASF
jgi:hypothetical protein